MGKDPRRLERFKRAMMFLHMTPGFETHHVLDLFNWHAYGQATVVDVGGSDGLVCIQLARKFPELKLIVQDLPEVIAEVDKTNLEEVCKQVAFMPHNFFEVQPVKDADIYFLRLILHDWPDQYCLQILRNLIPALKSGALILINELCIPAPDQVSLYQARWLRSEFFSHHPLMSTYA